jgi:hypothetical protein
MGKTGRLRGKAQKPPDQLINIHTIATLSFQVRNKETRKQGNKETRKQGNKETRKQGNKETRKQGNKETRKQRSDRRNPSN